MGVLCGVDRRASVLTVLMDDDRLVLYELEAASELELAYAMTVHKSQGNEFTAVVMPMFPGPPQLCYRNLLYTAITRAKNFVGDGGNAAYRSGNGGECPQDPALFRPFVFFDGRRSGGIKKHGAKSCFPNFRGYAVSTEMPVL